MFIFEFTDRYYLTEEEWLNNINNYINKLKNTITGNKMFELLEYYISVGYEIIISNYNSNIINQYPHVRPKTNNKIYVYFPDIPYFIKVPVIKNKITNNEFINNIVSCIPLNYKIDTNRIKYKYDTQKYSIMFAHELTHVLRTIFNCNDINEEEDTIYGLHNVLEVDGVIITENAFRRDFGLNLRISHQSEEIYIYGYENKLKLTKDKCKEFMEK